MGIVLGSLWTRFAKVTPDFLLVKNILLTFIQIVLSLSGPFNLLRLIALSTRILHSMYLGSVNSDICGWKQFS